MSLPPGTGHPDGEARPMPHGAVIASGSGVAVLAGGTLLISVGTTEVAAYRSVVVAVHNSGGFDVDITPKWTFYDGPGGYTPTQTQRVPAGTSKRLLFQNQGDLITTLKAQGVGGGSTIDWALLGANLDPLPSSAPDYLLLKGVHVALAAVPGGASGEAPFDQNNVQTSDASLWSFNVNGAGNIVEVVAAQPGRYESWVNFDFDPPSAASIETVTADIFGTIPVANKMSGAAALSTGGEFLGMVGAFTNYTSGVAQFAVNYFLSNMIAGGFVAPYWWIKRWAIS